MAPKKRGTTGGGAKKAAKVEDTAGDKPMDAEWSAAAADKRPRTKLQTEFKPQDSAASFFATGQLVQTTAAQGFRYLLSGGRASTGVKSGRYLFELTVLDTGGEWKAIRVGFGTQESGLIPGSDKDSFGADQDGNVFQYGKAPEKKPWRWGIGDVIGVFLNLEKGAQNANTVSFFRNGERLCPPVPLPESLHGKVLFPLLAVRDAAVSVNFGKAGARPLRELPFKATLLDAGAQADLVESTAKALDKPEVIVPVGLPNEGTYDFLDFDYYKSHPGLVECSDRALGQWLVQSGMRGSANDIKSFKVAELEQGVMLRHYAQLLAARKRSCVLVDVKRNLSSDGRAAAIAPFCAPWWTKKAVVAFGAAPKAFVEKVKAGVVAAEKQRVAQNVASEKAAWEQRQASKASGGDVKKQGDAAVAAALKALGEKAAPKAKAADDTPDWAAKAKVDEAALTKDLAGFRKKQLDVFPDQVARHFLTYSLPLEGPRELVDPRWLESGEPAPAKGEGFDSVEYAKDWATKANAAKYLDAYKKTKKVQEKFLELKKDEEAFQAQVAEWTKAKAAMRANVEAHAGRVKAQKERESKPKPEPKEGEEKKEGEDAEMKDAEEDTYDYANAAVDTAAADIHDADGHKTPLYKDFLGEDQLLLQVRAELHMLVKAFARDATAKDPERTGIAPGIVEHYYNFYFKKPLRSGECGFESTEALLKHCADTVTERGGVLACVSAEDLPVTQLVKAVETQRCDRKVRIASGDESARLKFAKSGHNRGAPNRGPMGKGGQFVPYQQQQQQNFGQKRNFGMMQPGQQQGFSPGPGAKRPMQGQGFSPMGGQQFGNKGFGKGW